MTRCRTVQGGEISVPGASFVGGGIRPLAEDLAAESAMFAAAQLLPFSMNDERGLSAAHYTDQPALLVNGRAHPSVLVGSALARARRAAEFSLVLENSGDTVSLKDASAALTRMIEEVVELLRVVAAHPAVEGQSAVGSERPASGAKL